ncbi:MAG: c-type cytochrome [Pyrinomonadaceae bacterium]
MKFLKIGLILLSISLFVFACTETDNTKTTPANGANKITNAEPSVQPTAADEMASARKIYTEKCVRCHKEDGSGGKTEIEGTTINAENLISDKMKKEPDAEYIEHIENGIPDEGMPAFKGKLTDQEIKDVVAFIRKELQGK